LPPVPRKGRKVWTVAQLQTFLQRARSDRFFALRVLEATSGMRRCELAGAHRDLLDLEAGTLAIETTRVVVDGRVIESDGKTENAQQKDRSRGRGVQHEAVRPDRLEAGRQVVSTLAQLIIGGSLASGEIADETGGMSEGAA